MTEYDPRVHHRHSMRLRGYDYSSAGMYFVTLCVQDHHCLFGNIVGATAISAVQSEMVLNQYGLIIHDEWLKTPVIRPNIQLDEFIIMPNHFHCIIRINNAEANSQVERVGAYSYTPLRSPSKSIGAIVRGFKSVTTKRINEMRHTFHAPVWQRNYYEHVIRDETSFRKIRQYIMDNPKTWAIDKLNPQCTMPMEINSGIIENPIE